MCAHHIFRDWQVNGKIGHRVQLAVGWKIGWWNREETPHRIQGRKKKAFLFLTFTNLHFRVTNGAFDLILHLRERANSIVTEAFWCKDLYISHIEFIIGVSFISCEDWKHQTTKMHCSQILQTIQYFSMTVFVFLCNVFMFHHKTFAYINHHNSEYTHRPWKDFLHCSCTIRWSQTILWGGRLSY